MNALFELSELSPGPRAPKQRAAAATCPSSFFAGVLGKRAQRCADVIGDVAMGDTLHFASMGEWSMHDLLLHLLRITGPADVVAATWSIREDPVRQLIQALQDGRITHLRMLLDWRTRVRCPEAYALVKNHADIRTSATHAKVTCLRNDRWQIAVVGSANFTGNPRIEAGVICADSTAEAFHRHWLNAEIDRSEPFEANP